MKKLGLMRCALEMAFCALTAYFFQFPILFIIRFLCIWLVVQLMVGRFQNKCLLVWDEIKLMLIAYAGTFLLTVILLLPFHPINWMKILMVFLMLCLDFLFGLAVNKYLHHALWDHVSHKALIIGDGKTAEELYTVCATNRFSLLNAVGFVHPQPGRPECKMEVTPPGEKTVWPLEDLDKVIEEEDIDTVLFASRSLSARKMQEIYNHIADRIKTIKYLPNIEGPVTFASRVEDFDGMLMISTAQQDASMLSRCAKRVIDICSTIPGLLILAPLTVFVYISNRKNGDTDPIFFVQERIGKDGKLFKMYKFRTMVVGAEQKLKELMEKDPAIREEYQKNKKLKDDPRVTKAGKMLRALSLDEFPQFINVLKGEMALVGPRPYLPGEKEEMGEVYNEVIALKPGVTGMWQTHGRSETDFEERLKLDSYYYRNWNLWLDITLLIRTVKNIFSKDSNDAY
jgi:undecaprenyl-phosphate galactose phosphotransferase